MFRTGETAHTLIGGVLLGLLAASAASADGPEPYQVELQYRAAGDEWSAPVVLNCEPVTRCKKTVEVAFEGEMVPFAVSVIDRGRPGIVRVMVNTGSAAPFKAFAKVDELARRAGSVEVVDFTISRVYSAEESKRRGEMFYDVPVADFRFTYL